MILDKLQRLIALQIRAMGGRSVFHVVDGRRVHGYEIPGKPGRPPLLLVHGLGASADTWASIVGPLRRAWGKIFIPDLPGFGLSKLEPGEEPLDLQAHRDFLNRYLNQVIGAPTALAGNSLGGALSLRLAVDRGDEVLALGLLSPAGAPFAEGELESLRSYYQLQSRADAKALIERMFHRSPRGLSLLAGDFLRRFSAPAVSRVLLTANAANSPTFAPEELSSLKMPTLLLWGESERLLPFQGIDFFRSNLPRHAHIEVLPKCGHIPQLEAAPRTAALLASLSRDASVYTASASLKVPLKVPLPVIR